MSWRNSWFRCDRFLGCLNRGRVDRRVSWFSSGCLGFNWLFCSLFGNFRLFSGYFSLNWFLGRFFSGFLSYDRFFSGLFSFSRNLFCRFIFCVWSAVGTRGYRQLAGTTDAVEPVLTGINNRSNGFFSDFLGFRGWIRIRVRHWQKAIITALANDFFGGFGFDLFRSLGDFAIVLRLVDAKVTGHIARNHGFQVISAKAALHRNVAESGHQQCHNSEVE